MWAFVVVAFVGVGFCRCGVLSCWLLSLGILSCGVLSPILMSSNNYNSIWTPKHRPKLLLPTQQLRVWGGKQLSILGEIHVNTKLRDKH